MPNDFGAMLLMFGPPVIGLAAVAGAIASGIALSRAPRGRRIGPAIVLAICSLLALGIGGCYGMLFLSLNQIGR